MGGVNLLIRYSQVKYEIGKDVVSHALSSLINSVNHGLR